MMPILYQKECAVWMRTHFGAGIFTGFALLSSFFFMTFLLFFQSSALIGVFLSTIAMIAVWICPFMTMKSFAQEKQDGTWILLQTSSLSLHRVWICKWWFSCCMWGGCLLITLIPIGLIHFLSHAPFLPTFLAYMGLFALGSTLCALGCALSYTQDSPATSGIMGLVVGLLWWMTEGLNTFLHPAWANLLAPISLQHHLQPFLEGQISLESVLFFITCTAVLGTVVVRGKAMALCSFFLVASTLLFAYYPHTISLPSAPPLSHRTIWVLQHLQTPTILTLRCHQRAPEFARMSQLLDQLQKHSPWIKVHHALPAHEAEVLVHINGHITSIPKHLWYGIVAGSTEHFFNAEILVNTAILELIRPIQQWVILGSSPMPLSFPGVRFLPFSISQRGEGVVVMAHGLLSVAEQAYLHQAILEKKPILVVLFPLCKNPVRDLLASRGVSANGSLIFEEPNHLSIQRGTPIWIEPLPSIQTKILSLTSKTALAGPTEKGENAVFYGPFATSVLIKGPHPRDEWVVIGSCDLLSSGLATLLHQPPPTPAYMLGIYPFRLTKLSFVLIAVFLGVVYPVGIFFLCRKDRGYFARVLRTHRA